MADYIVTSGELTTVANAIREKNGTSSSLSWPNGFVSGISSGGGGSSDFSTAEVTVINTTSDMVSVLAVSIRDTPSSAIVPFGTIMADSDRTHTVPLYKGVCSWKITPADAVVTVSGDISYDNRNIFITGDGTITIS